MEHLFSRVERLKEKKYKEQEEKKQDNNVHSVTRQERSIENNKLCIENIIYLAMMYLSYLASQVT